MNCQVFVWNNKHLAQSAGWFRDGPADPIRGYADVIKIKYLISATRANCQMMDRKKGKAVPKSLEKAKKGLLNPTLPNA